jgi:XTP/dITP diphosphohydrolase
MISGCLADFPHVTPAVEDGQTLAENACKKAVGYAQQLARWVLADDTGLEVDVLNGAPGVRSARYAGDKATMAENRDKLLADLSEYPESQWSARYVCHLAVANPAGELVAQTFGECPGRIRRKPAGESGFGYDVLFEVQAYGRTMAELTDEELATIGHRARALQSLAQTSQLAARKESAPFFPAK